MKKLSQVIDEVRFKNRPKNLTKEFQVYGVYLAETLEDTKHYSLYIKLAKNFPREILEAALNFCKDYRGAKSKARLFMWKLGQLKKALLENSGSK